MSGEIILRNNMRPVEIALCFLGLIATLFFLLFSFFGSLTAQSEGEIYIARILACTGSAVFIWKIVTLNAKKNYLETSEYGIRITGGITQYITWDNIKNITIEKSASEPDSENLSPLMPLMPPKTIYIELYASEKILFDSLVQKFSARKVENFINKLSKQGNRIPLDMAIMSAQTQEEICAMLQARWKLATK
ncbi:hypothetical protein [Maridesulfovibrio sp.]|uniref:hypothetical protein n=1 Tax=Maridesulfovibrio sp. TaxID=2795000 RepID=UPI002AA6F98D|nr:hypothetical protein [Maridesulfovibrio sp.]